MTNPSMDNPLFRSAAERLAQLPQSAGPGWLGAFRQQAATWFRRHGLPHPRDEFVWQPRNLQRARARHKARKMARYPHASPNVSTLSDRVYSALEEQKSDIGWGHQIRSYVLQPYQIVKDLRTGVEKGNPHAVLDGDLDDFMAAALAARLDGRTPR